MITPLLTPLEITSAEEADRVLASLVECRAELDLINATLGEAVGRAKDLAAQEAAPVLANVTILEKALEGYARENRAAICNGRRKSLKLTCGSFGYKSRVYLDSEDWAEVAAALAEAGRRALLIIREPEPDHKALAKLDDRELAELGIRRRTVETFYVAPASARVAEGG